MLPEKSSCLREKNNALKEYNQLFVDLKKNKDLWLKCFCKPGENKEKSNYHVFFLTFCIKYLYLLNFQTQNMKNG